MSVLTWITMTVVVSILWGGFAVALWVALKQEKKKTF